jgi:tetratricopeptide (TPR) repeat protein
MAQDECICTKRRAVFSDRTLGFCSYANNGMRQHIAAAYSPLFQIGNRIIMKHVLLIGIIAATAISAGGLLTASRVAAEPILGEDSLALPANPQSQKQELTDALSLFKAHDYAGSLKAWKEAVQKNPDMPPAQVIMAGLYVQTGMLSEAKAALEQAAIDAPNDPESYLLLADLAMRDNNLDKAEPLHQKASELLTTFNKNSPRRDTLVSQNYRGMAAIAEIRKDWAAAAKVYESWLKVAPKNVAAWRRMAFCLFQQRNADGALDKLRDAAKINKGGAAPEVFLAQFYEASGDRKSAQKWMAAALAAAPKDATTRLAVGQWALETGQLEEAQKHAMAAVRLAPKSVEAKLLRGVTALYQKDFAAAESIFDSAVKQSPQNVVATNNLALALAGQDEESKSKRALEYAEANAKKYPTIPEIASTYGLVLCKLGRIDDAETALRTAAPIALLDVDTAYAVSLVSIQRGRKKEAKHMLETALKQTKPFMFRQEAEDLLKELDK